MNARFSFPLPAGWFQIAFSRDLKAGESKAIHYFDQELVVFRTEAGEAHVVDAYCPHLGAHLGHGGEVKGDSIACPFHGWRFNGAGECVEVPYAKNMPPKVADGRQCLKSWPTTEKNQVIWVWHHPNNAAPEYEVEHYQEFDPEDKEWGDIEVHTFKIRSCCQELAENGADPAHFQFVHGVASFPLADMGYDDSHRRHGKFDAPMVTPKGTIAGSIETTSNGPGQSWTLFSGICDTAEMGNVTPIDNEYIEYQAIFVQRNTDDKMKSGVSKAIIKDICKQVREDSVIWEHKIYRDDPALCDGDGPIAKFRKWYSRFYV